MLRFLAAFGRLLVYAGNRLAGAAESHGRGRHNSAVGGTSQESLVMRAVSEYDMVTRPDEPYYARQYLHWILPEISVRFPNRRVRIIDLGCGQGRFVLPLAEWCANEKGRVTGVDLTPAAIDRARAYATERGLDNVSLHQGDVLDFIRAEGSGSADVILFIEVTFILPAYREVLMEAARVLRPNGLLFVAFRSQYFDVLHTVRDRQWDGAKMAIDRRDGHIFGGPAWFSWHTASDIRGLLGEAGLTCEHLYGIGVASGIEGDPLSSVAQPSKFSETEAARLMEIETSLAEHYAECGRYILAIAAKTPED